MIDAVAAGNASGDAKAGRKGSTGHGPSFGEVLSCLNPLQYLPVIGTIYRAVTGDTIPAAVREVGSLVVSGLTGGPIGVALAVGSDLAQRAIGFDQEKFGRRVLASLGIGHAAGNPARAAVPGADPDLPGIRSLPGIDAAPFAVAVAGPTDAETLNGLELARLAAAAYGRAGSLLA